MSGCRIVSQFNHPRERGSSSNLSSVPVPARPPVQLPLCRIYVGEHAAALRALGVAQTLMLAG